MYRQKQKKTKKNKKKGYYIVKQLMTPNEASKYCCMTYGTNLATVCDSVQNNELTVTGSSVKWIGRTYAEIRTGCWKYVNQCNHI